MTPAQYPVTTSSASASLALGFDAKRAARDRASLFSAAGLSWPEMEEPESVHARVTDYPFSVDVSNNEVLGALDSSGRFRRVVVADGIEDVRGRAIPGVYIHKQLSFWQGMLDLEVTVVAEGSRASLDPSTVGLAYRDAVIPVFSHFGYGLEVERTVLAPMGAGAEFLELLTLRNVSDQALTVELSVREAAGPRHDLPPLVPEVHLLTADGPLPDPSALEIPVAGELAVGARIGFHHPDHSSALDPVPTLTEIATSIDAARASMTGTLGSLSVPEDPWCGDVLTRASELARQSMLLLPDGDLAGSFWGSNANPLPDVWTRDFGYSALGLLDSHPDLAGKAIDFLARYGLPEAPWEREAEIHPEATGLQHSVGNACLAVVLADLFAQRHGIEALGAATASLHDHVSQLASALLAEEPGPEGLYRTLYISDGPSRGDFHIGSNILAWKAATALGGTFADLLSEKQASALASLATSLHAAITAQGVRVVDGTEMFVEGVYEDGQFVRVHDGEESDLTLASVYGFTTRDDHRIRAHAQWAQNVGDPYFARRTGGIDFWDWDGYNGVTYPGHIHMLSTAGTREELSTALRAIRETTDLDGSFWWWPFKHGETEPSRVKRSLGKCGWCAGEFVSFLIHDILGVRRNHDARTLTFAPYTPWEQFSLNGLAFAGGTVDLGADGRSVSITNDTPHALVVTLQVSLHPDDMIEDITLNGENFRYQSDVVSAYDSAAVRGTTTVEAGGTATLAVTVSH